MSRGRRGGLEGLLELLEVVSAGFWCQEHVLRFRGKSSPQPLLTTLPSSPSVDRLDRPLLPRNYPASILPTTTSRGDGAGGKKGKRKEKNWKEEIYIFLTTCMREIIEASESRWEKTMEKRVADRPRTPPRSVDKLYNRGKEFRFQIRFFLKVLRFLFLFLFFLQWRKIACWRTRNIYIHSISILGLLVTWILIRLTLSWSVLLLASGLLYFKFPFFSVRKKFPRGECFLRKCKVFWKWISFTPTQTFED